MYARSKPWASCQMSKIVRLECWERPPPPQMRVSDPYMHRGTCVTHVPWCMPGSLTSGFLWNKLREKRSRHSANSSFTCLVRGPCKPLQRYFHLWDNYHYSATETYTMKPLFKTTKSQNLNVSRPVLQLSLPNPLKPGVKSKMKVKLKQCRQAMLQLHLSDQQFYCLKMRLILDVWR